MARNRGQPSARDKAFLCYIVSQMVKIFVTFSGRNNVKSTLPHKLNEKSKLFTAIPLAIEET